jgi:hypothetical protein
MPFRWDFLEQLEMRRAHEALRTKPGFGRLPVRRPLVEAALRRLED